jgi:polyisoprenoid-binding protein YceI
MRIAILLAALTVSATSLAADQYTVDPSHASVVFKINHMGFSNVYGMFGDVSGDFTIDEQHPDKSNLNITIKTDSVDTKNAKRDEHLKKADFFDAKLYPTITFKSTSFKKTGGKTYAVKGDLTLHGKTKPISFTLTHFRTGDDPMRKHVTGGEAKFSLKRSDYGMNFMVGPEKVGDEVEIIVSLEGMRS